MYIFLNLITYKIKKEMKAIKIELDELKTLYVADVLVDEVHKYKCSDEVFSIAEEQSKYIKNKKVNKKFLTFNYGK